MKSVQLESVIVVHGGDHKLHVVALLHADRVRIERVLLGRHFDLAPLTRARRGLLSRRTRNADGE